MQSKHSLVFIFSTVLIDMIGFGIIMPVMPVLMMEITGEELSGAADWGGWLMFVYALLQFVFAPILGNLSDRYGRRPVLLLSLFTYAINYVIMGFATSLWLLFVGRVLTGMSGATFSVANAVIADSSPPEKRAQNFGLLGMALGLGFIFGPVLGGMLGEIGPRAPFFAAAGLATLNVIYGYFVLPETLPADQRRSFDIKRANPVGALLRIRRYPLFMGLAFTILLYQIGHHAYPSTWSFFTMEKFDWSQAQVGYSLGFVGLLMAIVQGGLIRWIIPRLGSVRAALLGFVAAAVSYVGISFAGSGLELYLWCIPSALAGLVMPAIQALMANEVPQNEQGELQGMIASLGSVGAIIGPVLMTQLFAHYSAAGAGWYFPGAPFLMAGVLTVLAVAAFLRGVRTVSNPGSKVAS